MRNEKMYGNRRENLIRANLRENGFQAETLLPRCKSYDPGSTFLGLKVKINKITNIAVRAMSSRITLLISTTPQVVNTVFSFISLYLLGFKIKEYANDTG